MKTYTKKQYKEIITEFMNLYNKDEIGLNNPINFDEAETLWMNEDEQYYHDWQIEGQELKQL